MFKTINQSANLNFGDFVAKGDVLYDADQHELAFRYADGRLPAETITSNLGFYGLVEQHDTVFIKEYNEHKGLAMSLVATGQFEIVATHATGPFQSQSFELRVLDKGHVSDYIAQAEVTTMLTQVM